MKRFGLPALLIVTSLCCGLLFVAFFANSSEVDCLRQADGSYACHKRTRFLDSVQLSDREFDRVTDIVVAEDCDEGCSYRAEFVRVSGGRVPLNTVYTNHGAVSRQVSELGGQMASGQRHITYKVPVAWWAVGLIASLTLPGAAAGIFLMFRKKPS